MCSHTLAAAEKTGVLKEFLNCLKSKKRSPNLSAIANVNMPKNEVTMLERGSGKVAAINHQLREDTLFPVGSFSLHSCPYPIRSHKVMRFLKLIRRKQGVGSCSLHFLPHPMRYHHVLLYLERTFLTKTPHLRRSSRPILRSILVMVLSYQIYRILPIIPVVHREKASKSRKTQSAHLPSASEACIRNLGLRQTCISGQQGYSMLWLWQFLEAKRDHSTPA